MRCRAAGIGWRRCSTARRRWPSSPVSSAPKRRRSSARRREGYRGPGETMFLPYLSGERTPHDDPHARGVVFGLGEAAVARRSGARGDGGGCVDARRRARLSRRDRRRAARLRPDRRRRAQRLWTRMIAAAVGAPITRRKGGEVGPAFGAARSGGARRDRRGAGDGLLGRADRRRDRARAAPRRRLRRRARAFRPTLSRPAAGIRRRGAISRPPARAEPPGRRR